MKQIVTTAIALALTAGISHAGNLESPWDRPPVIAPEIPSWTGLHFGAGITTRTKSTTEVTQIEDGFERECAMRESGTLHGRNKCVLSEETYDYLAREGTFREVDSPWNKQGLKADGTPGEAVLYDNAGYHGLWMNDNPVLSFASSYGGAAPTNPNKPTTNTMIEQTFTDLFTLGEDEEVAFTAHVRYLHDAGAVGGLILGGEIGYGGSDIYGEAQVGYAVGDLLGYVGAGPDNAAVGIDLRLGMTKRTILGIRAVRQNGDTRPEARISFKF